MKAELATSTVKIPHNGRFIHCRSVTTKIFGIPDGATGALKNKTVHLEIQRDGGPYLVLRMDKEGAIEIARQMLALAEGIEPVTAAGRPVLIGAEMKVKATAELPAYFHGMRVKVLRQSNVTAGLTVEALEKRGPYNLGDEIHVNQYDVETV